MTLLRRAFQVGYAFDRDLHANLDFDPIRDFPPLPGVDPTEGVDIGESQQCTPQRLSWC